MSQRGAGWRKAVGCARGRPSEGSAREACRVRSMSGQVAGPRGVGARGRCVKPRAGGGAARAVPRQSPRAHGDRGSPPPGALIDRMPRAAHPRMAPEQPKHPRCREIGVRGSPSRRFLRRGGVPIPPVTAALGPLPPRGERLRRRPAPGPPRQDRAWANGAGELWAVSRARTRAAARRSAGRSSVQIACSLCAVADSARRSGKLSNHA